MHVFKRFYLLGGLIASVCIPLITFTYYVEPSDEINAQLIQLVNVPESEPSFYDHLPTVLWIIYITGTIIFGLKFMINLGNLGYKIKHNPKRRSDTFTNVLLQDLVAPHTFFNYIFFNKEKYEAREIPKEVFWHEETHATQKHSIDVLLVEILQILFWFNPLIYIFKHSIKLNHEFLADQGVLQKGINTACYQETILAFSSNMPETQLANAINYSLIKKRFTVMKTKTTKRVVWLKSMVLLPILALSLYSFSDKTIIEKENDPTMDAVTPGIESVTATISIPFQEGATKEQIAEYNKLASKYNKVKKGRQNDNR